MRFNMRIWSPYTIVRFLKYQVRRPNDYILATMQSAGTHYLRFMLAKALVDYYELDYEFKSIHPIEIVPGFSLDAPHYFRYNDRHDIPRIQHTHLPYKFPFSAFFRNKKAILLIRDLRDALASHYRKYLRASGENISFLEFLQDKYGRIRRESVAGTLAQRVEFLNTWGKFHEFRPDRVLVVKYEELRQKPVAVLRQVLEFIGIEDVNDEFLETVVAFSSINNMRRIGQAAYETGATGKRNKQEALSVYKGIVGGFEELFDSETREYFLSFVNHHLKYSFGYRYWQ